MVFVVILSEKKKVCGFHIPARGRTGGKIVVEKLFGR